METTWILGVGVRTTSTGQLSTTACQAPKTKAIAWHWDMTPGSCTGLTHNSVMWEVTGGPHSPDTTPHDYGGLGGGRGQIQNQENFPLGLWSFDPTRKQYGELFNSLDSAEALFHKNFLETYRNFVKHFSLDLFSLIFLWFPCCKHHGWCSKNTTIWNARLLGCWIQRIFFSLAINMWKPCQTWRNALI